MGFLMDIFGALLGTGSGSFFSHLCLKEVMKVVDWVVVTLIGFGTIGVGAEGKEQESAALSIFVFHGWHLLFPSCWMSSVISKMGFISLEQGFHKLLVPIYASSSVYDLAVQSYTTIQTGGLKHGRAFVVSTCAAVASILTVVLAGMLALGEWLPSAPKAQMSLLLGWLLIIMGVILRVGSRRIVGLIRFPSHRFKRSSVDKNYSLRRPGTCRSREPNQQRP